MVSHNSHRFRVDVGFNDTALTTALEGGDEKTAVSIIKDHASDPSYFNVGPYDRIPLVIVLCGHTCYNKTLPVNLYLAKLLADHGAAPDKRPPAYFDGYMVEFTNNAIEYLLMVYADYYQSHYGAGINSVSIITPIPPVIGLNHELNMPFDVLQEQMKYLFDFFVVRSSLREMQLDYKTPMIHYLAEKCPDVEMMERVITWSSSINPRNIHGDSVLFTLCNVQRQKGDEDDYRNRKESFKYILNLYLAEKEEINSKNCAGLTPLFACMYHGHFDLAEELLLAGHPPYCGSAESGPWMEKAISSNLQRVAVPCLLAPFVPSFCNEEDSIPDDELSAVQCHRLKQLASLVDDGLFSNCIILEEELCELNTSFPSLLLHEPLLKKLVGKNIVSALLGGITAGLKQLCARTILQSMIHIPSEYKMQVAGDYACFCHREFPENPCHWTHEQVKLFLQDLRLPSAYSDVFELELYRWKLLHQLQHCRLITSCACETSSASSAAFSEQSSQNSSNSSSHEDDHQLFQE